MWPLNDYETNARIDRAAERVRDALRESFAGTGPTIRELERIFGQIQASATSTFIALGDALAPILDVSRGLEDYEAQRERLELSRRVRRFPPLPPATRCPPRPMPWPARMQAFRSRTKSRKPGTVTAMSGSARQR